MVMILYRKQERCVKLRMNSDELSGSVIVCCEAPSSGQQEVCGDTIQITVICLNTIQTDFFSALLSD